MSIRNAADLFVEATNSILPPIIRLTTVCELRQSSPPPNWPSIATHGRVEFHGYSDTPSGTKCFELVHLADRVAKFEPRESLSGRHVLICRSRPTGRPDCRPDARHIQGMRPVSWPRSGGPSNLRLARRGSGRETEITLRHAMRPRLRNPDFYQKWFLFRDSAATAIDFQNLRRASSEKLISGINFPRTQYAVKVGDLQWVRIHSYCSVPGIGQRTNSARPKYRRHKKRAGD